MRLSPTWRKAILVVHLASSLGWLGAVAAYFALALKGLNGPADLATRSAYLGVQAVGWRVIVPLGVASIATGVIQALGTPWGLSRHYWVLVKLGISALALGVLLLHMGPTDDLASAATHAVLQPADLAGTRLQLVLDSGAALIVLLAAAALGTYKPRGETPWARHDRSPDSAAVRRTGRWLKVFVASVAAVLVSIIVAHLTGHSPHQH